MPCFDARVLETDPDGLALLREVLGPPKVCASFGPETHAKLTRDEGCSFSGLEARERASVALHDPPPQAPEVLPSSDRPSDAIEQDGRPEIDRVVERPTPLETVGNGTSQGGDCDPGSLEAAQPMRPTAAAANLQRNVSKAGPGWPPDLLDLRRALKDPHNLGRARLQARSPSGSAR